MRLFGYNMRNLFVGSGSAYFMQAQKAESKGQAKNHGFMDAKRQKYKDTKVQKYKNIRIQRSFTDGTNFEGRKDDIFFIKSIVFLRNGR